MQEVSYRHYLDWRDQSRSFEAMAAVSSTNSDFVIDIAGGLIRFKGALVSASFFQLLGSGAQLGRTFTASDDRQGVPRVLVISDGLWRRQFGADSAAVGKVLTIRNQPFTIVKDSRRPRPEAAEVAALRLRRAARALAFA